jgi:hypothetical protein
MPSPVEKATSAVVGLVKEQFESQKNKTRFIWPNFGDLAKSFFHLCDEVKATCKVKDYQEVDEKLKPVLEKVCMAANEIFGSELLTVTKLQVKVKDWRHDGPRYTDKRPAKEDKAETTSPKETHQDPEVEATDAKKAKKATSKKVTKQPNEDNKSHTATSSSAPNAAIPQEDHVEDNLKSVIVKSDQASTAFKAFCAKMRARMLAEDPTMPQVIMAKETAKRWRELTPAQRESFDAATDISESHDLTCSNKEKRQQKLADSTRTDEPSNTKSGKSKTKAEASKAAKKEPESKRRKCN